MSERQEHKKRYNQKLEYIAKFEKWLDKEPPIINFFAWHMFDNRKIKHLRRLPEGNSIVLIWVMLLTMAGRCNSNGMIFLTENILYTPKMLADELDFEENTIILALNALEELNMIVRNSDQLLSVAGWEEYQNVEGMEKIREQNRLRKQAQRERKKEQLLLNENNVSRDSHVTVTQGHATDKEKEKEEEYKNKSVKKNTRSLFYNLLPEYSFSDALKSMVVEWVTYKIERKEPYKEQGMKSLLRQIENNAAVYGEEAVIDLIDECMAAGWKGIIFDRLKQKAAQKPVIQEKPKNSNDAFMSKLQEMYNEEC